MNLSLDGQTRTRATSRVWITVAALFIGALGLRLYHIGHASFWIDEVSSVEVAAQPLDEIVFNYQPGHHPWRGAEQAPLALVVMHFFLAPDRMEASARLPSALLGAVTVVALFLFARRLFPTPVAILAALFLALSPLHVWYSQEARWYAQWLLLTILSYGALLAVRRGGHSGYWIAYGGLSVLSIYTFILSFLMIATQGISILLLDRRADRPRRLLPGFLITQTIVVVLCIPVVRMILATSQLTTGTPRPKGLVEMPYAFFAYAAGYSAGPPTELLHALPGVRAILTSYPSVLVFAVVFAPLLLLGVRRVLADAKAAAVILPWCFAPPLLAYALSLVSNVTYQARYGSAALPAFLILVALGCRALPAKAWRVGAAAAVALCFLFSLANHYWNPAYAKEDVKSAVSYVSNAPAPAAPIAVVGQIAPAVVYYAPQQRVMAIDECETTSGQADALRDAAAADTLWLLVGRDWEGAAPRCLERLGAFFDTADQQMFPGVQLRRFVRRSGHELH